MTNFTELYQQFTRSLFRYKSDWRDILAFIGLTLLLGSGVLFVVAVGGV